MFLSNLYYFVDDQQIDKMIGGLSTMHLLCTDIEGCHQFVEASVMQHLVGILQHDLGRSIENMECTTPSSIFFAFPTYHAG